jgi:type IV pilus assembly protein PilO
MAITLDDIKKLSPRKKALIICLVYILFCYFYWSLFLQSALKERGTLDTKLSELKQQIAEKELIAAGKDKYIREIKVLRETFLMALKKLPTRKEMPSLLSDIGLAGKSAGIESILFEPIASEKKPSDGKQSPSKPSEQKPEKGTPTKPSPPEPETFYKEIPIKITVNGSFHNTVIFFNKIAKLPRIVNVEDISMGEGKDVKGSGGRLLSTSCVVKTYMFVGKPDEKKSKADEKNK